MRRFGLFVSSVSPSTRARQRRLWGSLALSLTLLVSGCGVAPAVRYAERGEFTLLAQTLEEEAKAGRLDNGKMRDVAEAVLEYDLKNLANPERIERLGGCAKAIKSPLKSLAKGEDEHAGAAALLLLETGISSEGSYSRLKDAKAGRARAAGTRSLTSDSDAKLRKSRAIDDDQFVRRAAVQAAGENGCASDVDLLLEAARKDPSPVVRREAIAGLGKVAPQIDGTEKRGDVVDRLFDLWSSVDENLHGAIGTAWASRGLFEAGGRRRLEVALSASHGIAAVDIAHAMSRAGGDGETILLAAAFGDDSAVRLHALGLLDLTKPEHLEALKKALLPATEGSADDISVRERAAERIAAFGRKHPAGDVFAKLYDEALVVLKAHVAREDGIGLDAAVALAELGDGMGIGRLQKELPLRSPKSFRAARALSQLGRAAEARLLVTDADLDVRDGAACAILSAR